MTPTVSVVVAAYQAQGSIDDCVRSLLALRYPADRLEVLVVDNGSADGTAAAVRRHGGRVRLLHEPRRGAGAARNAGLAQAGGDVVAFTDADCTVDPDWLRHLVEPLDDPQVGIVGGTIRARPGANQVERFGDWIHDHGRAIERVRPPYAITMNWASPRAVVERIGGFDEWFIRAQDTDLSFRMVKAGYRLVYAPGAVVYHHNESTLGGLFHEGFVHGFHSIRLRKRHHSLLRGCGNRERVSQPGYSAVARGLLRPGPQRLFSVYVSGKKLG